jgi:hypothetical protein
MRALELAHVETVIVFRSALPLLVSLLEVAFPPYISPVSPLYLPISPYISPISPSRWPS